MYVGHGQRAASMAVRQSMWSSWVVCSVAGRNRCYLGQVVSARSPQENKNNTIARARLCVIPCHPPARARRASGAGGICQQWFHAPCVTRPCPSGAPRPSGLLAGAVEKREQMVVAGSWPVTLYLSKFKTLDYSNFSLFSRQVIKKFEKYLS